MSFIKNKIYCLSFFLLIFTLSFANSSPNNVQVEQDSIKVKRLIEQSSNIADEDFEKAKFYLYQAEQVAKAGNLYLLQTDVYKELGLLYIKSFKLDSAQLFYEKGLEVSITRNLKGKEIAFKNGIGFIYYRKGDLQKTVEQFLNALNSFDDHEDAILKSKILNNIGSIYEGLGELDKAIEYTNKSLELRKKIGNPVAIAVCYNGLGNIYGGLEQYDKALGYYKDYLEIAEENSKKLSLSVAYSNIAAIYRLQEKFNEALDYGFKALEINTGADDIYNMAKNYNEIGFSYSGLHQFDKAELYLDKAMKIARQLKDKDLELELLNDFSLTYSEANDYKKAYTYYKEYSSLKDSLLTESKNEQIIEAEKKYETKLKNSEIKTLTLEKESAKKNQILSILIILSLVIISGFLIVFYRQRIKANALLEDKNNQLEQLTNTQNRLMGIISHDLKAPLSAFYSITNSLKTKFDIISREEIDRYFNRMLNSSIALKLQLENMLNWAINQSNIIAVNRSQFNLSILATKVVIVLQEFANEKSIQIKNTIDDTITLITDGNLLSIVLNNLIANAVKYSTSNSTITISAIQESGYVIISVKDTGIGMTADELNNLFTDENKGRNENSSTGLGLIVSKDIIDKLQGEIWAESVIEKGTTFYIKLKQN